jgi:hypothetical protein
MWTVTEISSKVGAACGGIFAALAPCRIIQFRLQKAARDPFEFV